MTVSPRLSVLVPVYNEVATVRVLLERVRAVRFPKEIIVVDDCSKDGTRAVLEEFQRNTPDTPDNKLVLVMQEENQGKGAAIRTAAQHATGDIVIIQDADLEYDPRDYPLLLEPILEGNADVVFGNRFHGGPHRVLYFWHYTANKALTLITNLLTGLNLSDMEVGYKVFRADVLRRLRLTAERFGIEPELTIKTAKLGVRIYEVPIRYHGRTYAEGKKITWRDGAAALYHIVRYRFFG
jgi:glycosyltransferase involved in cell wall biosynthesis